LIPIDDTEGVVNTATNFIRAARQLRRERFDLAVLLQNAFGAALLARAAGARKISGYPTDSRRALLHWVIPFEQNYKSSHQVRYYVRIASELERRLTGSTHVEMETLRPQLHVDV